MKLAKNRKLLVAMAIVLATVVAASATFAWVTSRNTLANEFRNEGFANGDGLVVYEEEDEFVFEIGMTTPKTVSIVNTGSAPMLARVTFEEMIKLLAANAQGDFITRYDSSNITTHGTAGLEYIRVPFNNDSLAGWTQIAGTGTASENAIAITPAPAAGVRVYQLTGRNMFRASIEIDDSFYAVDFSGTFTADRDAISGATYRFQFYSVPQVATYNSWNLKHNYAPWSTVTWINNGDGVTPATRLNSTVNAAEVQLRYMEANFSTTPTLNHWFYNADDGYFYFIGVLGGGESTPVMLTGVHLNANANQGAWQKHEYTLVVAVEGLQANSEALIDTEATGNAAGWQLAPGALLDALNAAIDAFNA